MADPKRSDANGPSGPVDSLLTVDEVAAWLRVARKTVLNWVYTRQLPCVKFGRCLRFKREDVEALIASRYKGGCDRL